MYAAGRQEGRTPSGPSELAVSHSFDYPLQAHSDVKQARTLSTTYIVVLVIILIFMCTEK